MTVPTREEEWAIWMRAAIAGDKAAYRRFLVAVTPSLRSLARRRAEGMLLQRVEVWRGTSPA